jgi:hypothetical protein
MSSRRKVARIGVAIVAAVVLFTTTSAQAAIQNLEFVNTGGSVTIGSLPALTLPVPGGGIAGEWDDVSGDFEGLTTFNPITIPANPPTIPVDVVVSLNADGDPNVTGTIDPATGEAALTAAMVLSLNIPALGITCASPSFDVSFTTDPPDGAPFEPLPFDDTTTYTMGLVGALTVPAFAASACGAGNEGIATLINQTLGTPAEGGVVLPMERGSVPPPPSTTTTTAAPTTTAAAGPATQPRFTG